MGTIGETGRLASFNNDIFSIGVDLDRSKYHQDGGVYRIQDGAIIRPGMIVTRTGADGLVIPVSTAAQARNPFGVAKWGSEPLGNSIAVDVPHVVAYNTAVTVGRGNVSNVVVRNALASTNPADEIPAAANYTLQAVAGTITWANPPAGVNAPANGATVWVTYTYALTTADFRFQGVKFHSNTNDDLTNSSENRITVITDWSLLFTTEWDTSFTYSTEGAESNLYCDDNGRFSNDSGLADPTNRYMGKVGYVPTADDPYMGVILHGGPNRFA